jgi:hypothetical protein
VSWVGSIGGTIAPYYRESANIPIGICCSRPPNVVNPLAQTIFTRIESGFALSSTRYDAAGNAVGLAGTGFPETSYPDFASLNASGGAAWRSYRFLPNFGGFLGSRISAFDGVSTSVIAGVPEIDDLFSTGYAVIWVATGTGGDGNPLNNNGEVVFQAERWFGDGTVRTTGELNLWSQGQGVRTLFRDGDPIPGGGGGGTLDFGLYTRIGNTRINSSGQVAFVAATGPRPRVFGDPTPTWGLFVMNPDGSLTVVARGNTDLPGLPGTQAQQPFNFFFNARGEIVFKDFAVSEFRILRARPTPSGYTFDLVARSGTSVEVNPGQFQILENFSLAPGSSGGEDGNGTALNDLGQIAYQGSFQFFGGSAVFLTAPTAPVCDSIDFNRDTLFPDSGDLDDFIAVLAGGPTACSTFPAPGCNDIDFNNDGLFPDSLDLDAFISRLAGGACLAG